jgi:tRNA pseudouridine32 synthase/23S rRNA pseudouridine746 synthase
LKAINFFRLFQTPIEGIGLPEKFTFPFYYEPHSLALIAAKELQAYLEKQADFTHNFGDDNSKDEKALGKMFGVLVVKNSDGELGYLSAFSGKVADSNHLPGFVPPVFDILEKDGFYKIEEQEVNELNRQLEVGMEDSTLLAKRETFLKVQQESEGEIKACKLYNSENKKLRKQRRFEAQSTLSRDELLTLNKELDKQSSQEHFFLKDLTKRWKAEIEKAKFELELEEKKIAELKSKRGKRSAELQKKIFKAYSFLNKKGESKSLLDIFSFLDPLFPPAGSGECAAPKLLHYAYQNNFEPIALAEFWWGQSPSSEIRQHKNYYPACKSKCEPILSHMLEGLEVDVNPLLSNPSYGKTIEIVYEDEHLLVVNKPNEFLSVPGVHLTDSVQTRMKEKYPDATGPLIVHRLDMSTSGLMIIALTKEVHKSLQSLFIKRSLKKRYVAILDGEIDGDEGFINLPLRLDIDDRPRQMVCFEHGKSSRTQWKVIERKDGKTKVQLSPITGRTHQLRVHSAHKDGLNVPILGDDLYGKKAERLYLHAESLEFIHPISEELLVIEAPSEF